MAGSAVAAAIRSRVSAWSRMPNPVTSPGGPTSPSTVCGTVMVTSAPIRGLGPAEDAREHGTQAHRAATPASGVSTGRPTRAARVYSSSTATTVRPAASRKEAATEAR
jgi:hypothetical protein